jgi:anti-anti-sigma factor
MSGGTTRGPRLAVTTAERDGATMVVISGEVDMATAGAFREALAQRRAAPEVVADLSGITFMDSSGVRAIDDALREVAQDGRRLVFLPQFGDSVRMVLSLTGVLDALPVEARSRTGGKP